MFCGLGTDPPGLASVSHQCRGAQGPGCWSRSRWSTHLLATFSAQPTLCLQFSPHHQRHRSPDVPPPSAGSRAPRLPDLTDFASDPLLLYVSLEFLRAPGYLLAPTPAGAPPPRHDKHSSASIYHHDAPLRLSKESPQTAQRDLKPPALPGRKHQILTAGIPASGQTSRLSSDRTLPPSPRKRLLPPSLKATWPPPFPAGPPPAHAPLEKYHTSPLKSLVLLRTP